MEVQNRETPSSEHARSSAIDAVAAADRPILVAVDFSQDCAAALIWASEYAEMLGAPLEILHVVHDAGDSPGTYKPDRGDPLEPMSEVAQRKLAAFLARVARGTPGLPDLESAKTLCTPGLPASTILQIAADHGARHVVLGGRQHAGLGRLFHGSALQQIAGHTEIPVTIVRAGRG